MPGILLPQSCGTSPAPAHHAPSDQNTSQKDQSGVHPIAWFSLPAGEPSQMKSGASTGITGTATAGIMIPVSAAVTATGIAQPWLIPVSFVISAALDKIVSPCFGRGNYQKQLGQAKYYQNLSDMQIPLIEAIEESAGQLECFINTINSQRQQFAEKTYVNSQLNKLQRRGNEVLSNKSEIDELNTLISKI